jgi:hypothetical protein
MQTPLAAASDLAPEAVEDDIEAVLELVRVVIGGLHDVFGDHCSRLGYSPLENGWSMYVWGLYGVLDGLTTSPYRP